LDPERSVGDDAGGDQRERAGGDDVGGDRRERTDGDDACGDRRERTGGDNAVLRVAWWSSALRAKIRLLRL